MKVKKSGNTQKSFDLTDFASRINDIGLDAKGLSKAEKNIVMSMLRLQIKAIKDSGKSLNTEEENCK